MHSEVFRLNIVILEGNSSCALLICACCVCGEGFITFVILYILGGF